MVGDMNRRGFLRGLRIYLRDWRPPTRLIFGLMFGLFGMACGARFMQCSIVGMLLGDAWELVMRKGWIRAENPASSPE